MTTLKNCKLFSLTSSELDITLFGMGLRFHSDILNLKCRKVQKTYFILTDSCESFAFIHFTVQVEEQKVTGFSLLFNFIHAKFCLPVNMQLVDSLCSFHDQL